MKSIWKFILICICITTTICAFAGPHGHRRHGGPGGPPHHHYGYGRRSDGLWLAAGITNIVGNGLGIINAVTPRYVTPAPVYTAPVYTTPVQPVVTAPAPVYYNTPYVDPNYYTQPVQVVRHVPVYDPWGRIVGYRPVVTYVK